MPQRRFPIQGTSVQGSQYSPYPPGIAVPTQAATMTPGAAMRIDGRMQPSHPAPVATTVTLAAEEDGGVVTLTVNVTPADAVGTVVVLQDDTAIDDVQWEGEELEIVTEALDPETYLFLALFVPDDEHKYQSSSDEAEVIIAA